MIVKTLEITRNETIIINNKYRLKTPNVVVKTWYGIKIVNINTFRLVIFDKELRQKIYQKLDYKI